MYVQNLVQTTWYETKSADQSSITCKPCKPWKLALPQMCIWGYISREEKRTVSLLCSPHSKAEDTKSCNLSMEKHRWNTQNHSSSKDYMPFTLHTYIYKSMI